MTIVDKTTNESDFLDILLKNRHISPKNRQEFLSPSSPKSFPVSSFGLSQEKLSKAVNRIKIAINNQENILIYGDYDVDGITATTILWQVLYKNKAKVTPFVPDRELDGYGIKAESFFRFQTQSNLKFDLLITVDNGIVANSEIQKISDSGVDIIVTDHHVASSPLPKSVITSHSTDIAGSAVSWLLSQEIDSNADLGLVALGTVADCLPLNNINRNLVFHGLKSLQTNPSCGIKKLIELSGIKQDSLSTYDLGFVLGPRINAVGRLSNPTDALRLLCSFSSQQANKFAQTLDGYNKDRQSLQQESILLAQKQIEGNQDKVLFVANESFHPGIIGLIAGRLTEKFYLPTIAISIGPKISKGSCRSIKELNIIESLRKISDLFIDLGGHAGAAGFSVETKKIPQLKKKIISMINQELAGKKLKPDRIIDAEMKLNAVTVKNCRLIKKLEPFGMDNLEPVFLFKQVRVVEKRLLGSNQDHLKLKVDDPSTPVKENILIDSIAFKKGEFDSQIKVGDLIDFTANLSLNVWNGYTSPQLVVKDFLK